MRGLILNDASLRASHSSRPEVVSWLQDLVAGVRVLVGYGVAERELRMRSTAMSVPCLEDFTLFDAVRELRRTGDRDAYAYLLRLTSKSRWLDGLPPKDLGRFHACEERELPAPDGEPVMLCVVTGAISAGFPSNDLWDADRIEIRFDELLPSGTIEARTERIDNLTRSAHARAIAERHRASLRSCAGAAELWRRRREVFPHLRFGPGVEANLAALGGHLAGVAEKLSGLDTAAEEWKDAGGDAPRWRTKVTPESARTRKDPALLAARRFPSESGGNAVFEWHARYGDGGRIHLRFDGRKREIEIGYIGPHLPL